MWPGDSFDIAWFPDGKRVAVLDREFDDIGKRFRGSVRVVDVESCAVLATFETGLDLSRLWMGPGGTHLYAQVLRRSDLFRIDVASGECSSWELEGLVSPLAFSDDGMVVGFALPTEGSKQEYATSPLYGSTPKYAIQLFDLASGAHCTVAPPVGRFEVIRAGEIRE